MAVTVAVFGTNGGTCFSSYGFDNALARIGMNTGNAVFQFALWKLIANPKFAVETGMTAQEVCENAQHILIPAANQVNSDWDMGWLADMLEECDLPVTCVGLGAQASLDSNPVLNLKPGTIRYLKVLSERCVRIGVRGLFTKEVLAHHGVTNTVITGCPSQTINSNITGSLIQEQLEAIKKIRDPLIGYVLGTLEVEAREAERNLAHIMAQFRHDLILQTDPHLMRLVFDRKVAYGDEAYVEWVGKVIRPDLSYDEFVAYFLRHGVFYSDARSWIDAMRRRDLVLGMRIHGAVTAIQAGKLGVCVAFDSRTKELAETMGYPYLPIDRIKFGQRLPELLDHVVFDVSAFDQARRQNTDTLFSILQESGLSIADT